MAQARPHHTTKVLPKQATVERARVRIQQAIRDWVALFGSPPSALDWNPALARKRKNSTWKVERYENTGRKWPSVSFVVQYYGTWNDALEAAGYPPLAPGAYRDGRHIREVNPHAGPVKHWTKERLVASAISYYAETGHWPSSLDWRHAQSGIHPNGATVYKVFDHWHELTEAAKQQASHACV
jgi:hypothetical protein